MSIRIIGRGVRLAVSDDVRCAAAIGVGSPVIAVAPLVLQELDDEELDQVLVHEWAHIQRRDDIARLFQLFIDILAGFNPAIWWIGRRLDLEREVACDDHVIGITGARTAYAKSLMKLAAVPGRPFDFALASAALPASKLTTRILRLLDGGRNVSTRRSLLALSLAAPGLLVLAFAIASMKPVTLATTAQASSRASASLLPLVWTMKESIATAGNVGRVSDSLPESDTLRHPPPQRSTERVFVEPPSSGSTSEPVARIAPQPMPTILPGSRQTDHQVDRSAQLAALPVAVDMMRLPPVFLAEDSAPPMPSMTRAPSAADTPGSPWIAAANAGSALGRTSQRAATETAGFFARLSRNVAGSF
jgi:hypothetical protein